MKKLISLVLALLMVVAATVTPYVVSATTYGSDVDIDVGVGTTDPIPDLANVAGNVNADAEGKVNLDDVVALAQIVAGWQNVAHNPSALDVNGDGDVNLDDVVLLAQFVAGWDVELSQSSAGSDLDFDMSE